MNPYLLLFLITLASCILEKFVKNSTKGWCNKLIDNGSMLLPVYAISVMYIMAISNMILLFTLNQLSIIYIFAPVKIVAIYYLIISGIEVVLFFKIANTVRNNTVYEISKFVILYLVNLYWVNVIVYVWLTILIIYYISDNINSEGNTLKPERSSTWKRAHMKS